MKRLIVVILCVALTACGALSKGKKSKAAQPSPLPQVQTKIEFKRLWEADIGADYESRNHGLVYVLAGNTLFTTDPAGRVTAFDVASGKERWERKLDIKVSAGVGVGEGQVYVVSTDAEVLSLDQATGKTLWKSQMSNEVLAPPVAEQGVVVTRTIDGGVVGLSMEDGKPRWNFRRSVPSLSLRGSSGPALHAGVAVLGFANGKILASDLDTGRVLWEVSVSNPRGRNEIERLIDVDAKPLLVGSVLYVAAYQGRVMAMALGSRRILWARDISVFRDISADSDNVYVSDDEGRVHALDRLTGSTVWKQEKLLRRGLSGPVPIGQNVVVGDEEGYLHILSRTDGRLIGQRRIDNSPIRIAPLVSGNRLYLLSDGGQLAAYAL